MKDKHRKCGQNVAKRRLLMIRYIGFRPFIFAKLLWVNNQFYLPFIKSFRTFCERMERLQNLEEQEAKMTELCQKFYMLQRNRPGRSHRIEELEERKFKYK
ncbi:hypothetical protein AB6A40_010938 [Gnathostoma spinigerum]|uniref:Uncharacterized protein n=1 Tax=Gnathostoma spinigerum TaxID=75299 RepID=A0ABD6F2I7_9BILA